MPNQGTINDPIKNDERIKEIARLKLHEDVVDEILNQVTEKAAKEFDLGIGLVSVVLDDAQKFAGSHGLQGWIKETNGTPLEWSFCANSVKSGKPFIVENALEHAIVKNNPLVQMDGIRCYAGVPMITSKGYNIGNFCVIGDQERSFSKEDIEKLKEFSKEAVDRIEERIS